MDNRDIFDEEYDKLNNQPSDPFDSWSGYTPSQPPVQSQNKPFKIVFIAIAMVVCIALGWVLAVVTSQDGPSNGNDDTRQDILNEVFNYMDYNFYEEISDAEWQLAVEQAGSALMQYAGDQYSFLMSPQTYYDYTNDVGSVLTAASNMNELFGMTYTMETKGMLISDVMADSVSYGNLQAGDMIVKMTNIKEYIPITDASGNLQADENGNLLVERYSNGTPKLNNSPYTSGILLEGATTTQVGAYLQIVYSATFHVLRNGEIFEVSLARNKVGIAYDEDTVDQTKKRYDFNFVEYYFSDSVNNISTTNQNGSATSTYNERALSNLPANVGYVRITQFDMYGSTSCYSELKTVMEFFQESNLQYLVLDLKGNPGGYVHLTANIAGLLIHPDNLTAEQKSAVEVKSSVLDSTKESSYLVTRLTDRQGKNSDYTTKSSYYNYFPQAELSNGKKRIIVWTDGGSASASELLTGTLLDYGTAVQMGTNTYGKGIAQTIEELNITGSYTDIYGRVQNDGAWAVYYTFANYYSPLGTNIHGKGYAPIKSYQAQDYGDLWTLAKGYWGI